jgi:hypothetical protein
MSKQRLTVGIVAAAIFVIAIPLPFKPSIWSYVTARQIQKQLDKSTADVLLPNTMQNTNYFTLYRGWTDAYFVQADISYYQLSGQSKVSVDSEGPDHEEVAFLQSVINGLQCQKSDSPVVCCTMVATEDSDARQFVAKWYNDTVALAEATTINYPEGISTENGQYKRNYRRIDDQAYDKLMKGLGELNFVDLAAARQAYFKVVI